MRSALSLFVLVFIINIIFINGESSRKKTLVMYDTPQIKSTHSAFFSSLEGQGHELTYASATEDIFLQKFGEFLYDNLVIFAPATEGFGEATNGVDGIISFIDSGRNVLIAANNNITEPIREIANLCGIDFDEDQTVVIDHFNSATGIDNGDNTIITSNNVISSPVIVGRSSYTSPILYSGIGHAYSGSNADSSPLLYKVLTGSSTTYSHTPSQRVKTYPQSAGTDTLLVTGLQTRNNGRVVFSGSLDLFSNKFFSSRVMVNGKSEKSGNEEFAVELSKWNFQGRGLLRAYGLTHRLADRSGQVNPLTYRVKDQIEFSVTIEEYDVSTNTWLPFIGSDVLLDFVMIDPYLRLYLKHDNKGHFSTKFQLPDVYGVYKFVIHYQKLGYTFLDLTQQVSVHPFRHNEFERFIDVAFPYYASAFSMMAAFFIFGFVFLYQKE